MACRNSIGTQNKGFLDQLLPLNLPVADYTGVRRAPGHILADEIVDDFNAETIAEIKDVVWKTESGGHGTGIIDPVQRTAAALLSDISTRILVCVGLESNPDQFVSLPRQKPGSHRGIDSAAHRHYNFLPRLHLLSIRCP
jgi:hypothetical protein